MTMPNRRTALRLMAMTGAALTLPVPTSASAAASTPASASAAAASGDPFTRPLPIPQVLQPIARTASYDLYRMHMRPADIEVLPGLLTRFQTFEGQLPGPTIRARRGRTVVVEQINGLTMHTAVHLHGGHVSHDNDGYPLDVLMPGDSRRYVYHNRQQAATLWYHDHAHMAEAENVYRGLAGVYILEDEHERSLPLPAGRHDIPLALRDAKIEADGTLTYDGLPFHPTIMVNGASQPYLRVEARRYRFRILNIANSRIFNLALSTGDEFVQIASDGGLLRAPNPIQSLQLYPAERAEVVVDFSRYPVGSHVILHNTPNFLPGEPSEILRFDVVRSADADHSAVPQQLLPADASPEFDAQRPACAKPVQRDFVLSFDMATGMMLINGKSFDPNRVDIRPVLGAPEIWTVTNGDTKLPIPHTFHVHQAQFHVLDRDGKPPAPGEAGRKDTIALAPGETVRILIRFTEYTGRYVYHCHMLEHSAMGMMGQMELIRP